MKRQRRRSCRAATAIAALGAAGVGDECVRRDVRGQTREQRDVLQDGRGQHDQVGARDDAEIVAADVGGAGSTAASTTSVRSTAR